jgi:hypothetical protein
MGTWGVAILSDDFAADIYGDYMERYDDGEEHAAIREYLERDNAEALDDEDECPVFYYALAKAQWECGALETNVLQRVRNQITSGDGLERWEEDGATYLKKRNDALAKFLAQINTPKVKPRKRRKIRHAPASYQPGDCIAITLDDGDYGAALVLATDTSAREEDYSLVVLLKYKSSQKPQLSDFERRQWLCPTGTASILQCIGLVRAVSRRTRQNWRSLEGSSCAMTTRRRVGLLADGRWVSR